MPENIPLTDILSGGTNSLRTEITNIPAVTNANLNIQLSALRDAITKTGETVKSLADIVTALGNVKVNIDQTTPGTTNAVVNKNANGNEIFTDASPGSMKLTGSITGVGVDVDSETKAIKVQEQSAFSLIPVPLTASNAYISNGIITTSDQVSFSGYKWDNSADGATMTFNFTGRRIGVVVTLANNFGELSFAIDGTAYGTLNTGGFGTHQRDDYPITIATDLTPGDHTLVVTKMDSKTTYITGFLVDSASGIDFYRKVMIDYKKTYGTIFNVADCPTAPSAKTGLGGVLLSAVMTNTTGSVITITFYDDSTAICIIPVPANGNAYLPSPIGFTYNLKISASASGLMICAITQAN